jgi:hemerythrin superfamily protein
LAADRLDGLAVDYREECAANSESNFRCFVAYVHEPAELGEANPLQLTRKSEVRQMTTAQEQDVVTLLLEQHTRIRNLFRQLVAAPNDQKQELFEDLVRLLAVHETAEEEVVHPTARMKLEGGAEVVDSRLREEGEAKQALAELYDLGVDHPEFDYKLAALAEAVDRHATNEENEEFSRLRETVPAEQLQRMAGALKTAETMAPTRPHPMTPESATGNLLMGPPLAVFDRIRDAMREWQQKSSS